jgi:hypothetical protein
MASLGPAQSAHADERAVQAADCPKTSRTTDCEKRRARITFDVDGVEKGAATVKGTLAWRTKVNSQTYTAVMTLEVASSTVPVGSTATYTAECPATCGVDGSVTVPLFSGATATGTFTFTDPTPSVHSSLAILTITPDIAGADTNVPGGGPVITTIRCDDMFRPRLPGCIVEDYIPTIDTLADLPFIGRHISNIQSGGTLHYGWRPGRYPLTRNTSKADRNKNYNAVCRGKKPPKKLPHGWPDHEPPSCDEYPFASTHQGGTNAPQADRGITFVPKLEQDTQGGLLSNFYANNRLIDKDPFWVDI